MDDNKVTPSDSVPSLCTAGCGFYGNKIYNNMCSKCFKAQAPQSEQTPPPKAVNKASTMLPAAAEPAIVAQIEQKSCDVVIAADKQEEKPKQKNTSRCFSCDLKIPLSKQVTNKCRCEYIFCDTHRYPDKHSCDFDHASMDRDVLAKNNPKLNERPKGGRSFQRLDSL